MKHLKYYISESPLVKGKFMAKTVSVNTYNDEDLIDEMMLTDRTITKNEIKKVLKLLISTSELILSKGNNILIPDFLKISPVIQGAFSSHEESFTPKKHNVSLNFVVSPVFMKNFQRKIKVQKTDKKSRYPYITSVHKNKTGENVIRKDNANYIRGYYLVQSGGELDGINIISKEKTKVSVMLEKEDFEIISFTSKELIFNISRKWNAPAWLESGMEILIRLRYKNVKEQFETVPFKTKWE